MTIHDWRPVVNVLNTGRMENFEIDTAYEYITLSGETAYALFTDARFDDVDESPYVVHPICLMYHNKITEEGKQWLLKHQG